MTQSDREAAIAARREKIRARIKERAAAAKKKQPNTVKPARTLNRQKQQKFQQQRLQRKSRQAEASQKLKSGRVTPPTAVSEEIKTRLETAQRELDGLQDDVLLTSIHDDMGELEATLASLSTDLATLRTNGYAFKSYLENKINVLTDKWEDVSEIVEEDIEEQSAKLERDAEQAERFLRRAASGSEANVKRAETAIESLESKASSARRAVSSRYDDIAQTIRQTRRQLDEVQWAFEEADQATFDFLDAEYLIMVCRAKLLEDRDDADEGEEGNLYLTDERLIFEQKEKVATKKFLFVTTSSETVHELEFETLLGWIEKVEAQDKKKFLSTKDLLHLSLSPDADRGTVSFRLLDGAKNEDWSQLLNRAISGEIERERIAEATEEKEAATEQVADAPTSCSMCGATLPATLVRGQSEITCEYCGTVVRL